MSPKTIETLAKLKAHNFFWYVAIIGCARVSPKCGRECIMGSVRHLLTQHSALALEVADLNVFEVSAFARDEQAKTLEPVASIAWEVFRNKTVNRILDFKSLK